MREFIRRHAMVRWNMLILVTVLIQGVILTKIYAEHLSPGGSEAAVPRLIPFRGNLYENNLPAQNSSQNITFTLYDALTGGNTLWSEIQTSVAVANGVFGVVLGSVTDLSSAAIMAPALYLGIGIGSAPELAPRQRIYAPTAFSGIGHGVAPGTIAPYGGVTVPAGWLACDGTSLLQVSYPVLFAAIGSIHGTALNGFFNLPDLRGMFVRGWDASGDGHDPDFNARTVPGTTTVVAGVGSFQGGGTASPVTPFVLAQDGIHQHAYIDVFYSEHSGDDGDCTVGGNSQYGSSGSDWDNSWCTRSATTQDAGIHTHLISGGDAETRPVNVAVMYIIKY